MWVGGLRSVALLWPPHFQQLDLEQELEPPTHRLAAQRPALPTNTSTIDLFPHIRVLYQS